MASIVVSGDTSGAVTLSAPSVAGTTTVTLPSSTGTMALLQTPSFATTIGVGGATASASGSGISFPATQSASSDANTLDDYEEGTWTPSVGGNTTYTVQVGSYVKIGNLVYISGQVNINLIGTGSLTSITNLPFSSKNIPGVQAINVCYYANSAITLTWVSGYVLNNSTTTNFTGNSTTATTIQQNGVNFFGNGATVVFNACYSAA